MVNNIHVVHVMTMQGSTRVPGVTREVAMLYGVCMNELKVCILPPLSPFQSELVLGGHKILEKKFLSISLQKLHRLPFCKKTPKIPQFASLIIHSPHFYAQY